MTNTPMRVTKTGQPIPERVITFGQGLPGFEDHRRFVLMASPALDPFALLQGAGADAPSFVGIDPRIVDPGYQTPLRDDDPLAAELAPYRGEKGNLRFPLAHPIPYDLIARIAEALARQAQR